MMWTEAQVAVAAVAVASLIDATEKKYYQPQ